eukprot:6310753-Amphidinium_carterae.2
MSSSCWCVNVKEVQLLRPNPLDDFLPFEIVHLGGPFTGMVFVPIWSYNRYFLTFAGSPNPTW